MNVSSLSLLFQNCEAGGFENDFLKRHIHRREQNGARHLITFYKERSNDFPEGCVVVKYDAILVHANKLQPKFATKSGDVVIVLHYVEHT